MVYDLIMDSLSCPHHRKMNQPLSKEELRAARLRALDKASNNQPSQPSQPADPPSTVQVVVAESSVLPPSTVVSNQSPVCSEFDICGRFEELLDVIYVGGEANEEDLLRWNFDSFRFCVNPPFGLKQGHGGPCGILAVIQAELIASLFFSNDLQAKFTELPTEFDSTDIRNALVSALAAVLVRASTNGCTTVVTLAEGSDNPEIPLLYWNRSELISTTLKGHEAVRQYISCNMKSFEEPCGCLLFLLSLVISRGTQDIKSDMDDNTSKLIGRFGHCNQELINLLMTGQATTNVFDGQRVLGDEVGGMVMRGISGHHNIGYLSYLEAMRYCEVGNYLKVPKLPIWVVGSSSHFTILFTLDKSINDETNAEKLLSNLRRSFKAIDKEECGFIPCSSLIDVLLQINIHHDYDGNAALSIVNNPNELARLRGFLQSDGEIIIWNSFWESVSRLMMGESLDTLLDVNTSKTIERSDSAIARELQEKLDSDPNFDFSTLQDAFAPPPNRKHGISDNGYSIPSAMAPADGFQENQKRFRSDSEIARELQAQWDAEDSFGTAGNDLPRLMDVDSDVMSTAAVGSNTPDTMSMCDWTPINPAPVSYPSAAGSSQVQSAPEEKVYTLYHYNGLQNSEGCGTLTKISLVRKDADISSIGKSVTLGNANTTLISNRPLEEVMWTKWSEARIRWSQPDPKID